MKQLPLEKPILSIIKEPNMIVVDWKCTTTMHLFQWVVYSQYGNEWEISIFNKNTVNQSFPSLKDGKKLNYIAVKAIDRLGNESQYVAQKI